MKFTAHFYLLNYDYSPEFAEAHYNGEESENNRFYDWEDELALTNSVKSIRIKRHTTYTLKGEDKEGNSFAEDISDMLIFEITGVDESITLMGCSEKLISFYEIERTDSEIILKVTLEGNDPLSNPIPGIYIAAVDFPKSLID